MKAKVLCGLETDGYYAQEGEDEAKGGAKDDTDSVESQAQGSGDEEGKVGAHGDEGRGARLSEEVGDREVDIGIQSQVWHGQAHSCAHTGHHATQHGRVHTGGNIDRRQGKIDYGNKGSIRLSHVEDAQQDHY